MSLSVKELEEIIEGLNDCSELEFNNVYSRVEDSIKSYPFKNEREELLDKLEGVKDKYWKEREVKHTFGRL